jgi:hypothetical protein
VFSAIKLSVDRWHHRLGHPSRDIVRRVISKNNLPCALFDSSKESVCDACACAKAHKLPYSISSSCSSAPLELVYSDVWGPAIDSFGQKNTMSVLLMIIVNSLGFTCSDINLRSPHISLNFKSLLNACLIAGLSLFNLTGEESMRNCIPFFDPSGYLIMYLAHTHTSKMGLLSGNIATLWRWDLLFLLM